MKKIIFTLVFVVSGVILANAQCTPGTYTSAGIYPDTATNLPHAYVGHDYAATMTAVVPLDTTVSGIPLTIDSIGITGITGLPSSNFTYAANTHSGYFKGGTSGCILISATAANITSGMVGTYHLVVATKAYVSGLTQSTNVTGYKIIIDATGWGINELSQNAVSLNAYSDASNNSIVVKINSSTPLKDASLSINDITGRELMRMDKLNSNDVIMNRGSLSNGIYIISLRNSNRIIAREKIFVE